LGHKKSEKKVKKKCTEKNEKKFSYFFFCTKKVIRLARGLFFDFRENSKSLFTGHDTFRKKTHKTGSKKHDGD
jgi:hypothetical protein